MNNPLGVSPSKGNQGTTRGKEKSFDLGGNRTHDLRILPLLWQRKSRTIGPQHNPTNNPTNHLCQPQPFVPHSSSSIPFFPFLSPLSFSMLSLVFPVFAAPLRPRLMQFCSHCLVLPSWCGRWMSIFSFVRPHWGFLSQPSSGLLYLNLLFRVNSLFHHL